VRVDDLGAEALAARGVESLVEAVSVRVRGFVCASVCVCVRESVCA